MFHETKIDKCIKMAAIALFVICGCSQQNDKESGTNENEKNMNHGRLLVEYRKPIIFKVNDVSEEVVFFKERVVPGEKKVNYKYLNRETGQSGWGNLSTEKITLGDGSEVEVISNDGSIHGFKDSDIKCKIIDHGGVIFEISKNVLLGFPSVSRTGVSGFRDSSVNIPVSGAVPGFEDSLVSGTISETVSVFEDGPVSSTFSSLKWTFE